MLQYRAVYPATLGLLKKLMQYKSLQSFFLVGGTALALQLGHRISVDIDLFTNTDFDTEDILQDIGNDLDIELVLQKPKNSMIINAKESAKSNEFVKIDLVKYPYPLINKVVTEDTVRLLSVADIIAMKLSAIANRGAKKDFYDIYELLKTYSIAEMFKFFSIKYPNISHFHILKSLTYFNDAESEFEPISLNNTDWKQVKTTIINQIEKYM